MYAVYAGIMDIGEQIYAIYVRILHVCALTFAVCVCTIHVRVRTHSVYLYNGCVYVCVCVYIHELNIFISYESQVCTFNGTFLA